MGLTRHHPQYNRRISCPSSDFFSFSEFAYTSRHINTIRYWSLSGKRASTEANLHAMIHGKCKCSLGGRGSWWSAKINQSWRLVDR